MKISLFKLGLAALAIYSVRQRQRKDVPVVYQPSIPGNFNALTIPPFGIYINDRERGNNRLLAHELEHWKQYQDKGLIGFYFDYFNQYKKNGYDGAQMEIDARYAAGENCDCQHDYTDCIRTGRAVTTYNPNFRR